MLSHLKPLSSILSGRISLNVCSNAVTYSSGFCSGFAPDSLFIAAKTATPMNTFAKLQQMRQKRKRKTLFSFPVMPSAVITYPKLQQMRQKRKRKTRFSFPVTRLFHLRLRCILNERGIPIRTESGKGAFVIFFFLNERAV